MKRENIIWLAAFAAFVFFCFFMRLEMQRNRVQLSSDFHDEISKAPSSILNAASDSIKKAAEGISPNTGKTNSSSTPSPGGIIEDVTSVLKKTVGSDGSSTNTTTTVTTNTSGGVIDDIASVLKKTVGTDNSSTTNATNTDLEGVGVRVLDAATQTARKVDRIGLDATRMTDQQESQFGADMAKSVTNEFKIIPDSPEYARIDRLMAPILEDRKRQQIQYTFHVVDSKMVNAFSLAGGYIYITTAFLHQFPADASLVMALSHEVGHVELRHCAEKVQYARIGDKTVGGVGMLGGALYNALSTPYTKDQEFAADEYGFLASRKAGWNAAELISLFTQLDAYERREGISSESSDTDSKLGTKLKNYFSSHPPTVERKERLEKLATK